MPTYVYQCKKCNKIFEIRHSMSERQKSCIHCESEKIFKVPNVLRSKKNNFSNFKPGKLVDEYITQTKEEVKKEKHRLKNEEF